MGNLIITKIWGDSVEPFGEIQIEIHGNEVNVKRTMYVTDADLSELSESLVRYVREIEKEMCWSNGTDCTFYLFRSDAAMHNRIKVTVSVDDLDDHICQFYVDGVEDGALEQFGAKLHTISVGETVSVY